MLEILWHEDLFLWHQLEHGRRTACELQDELSKNRLKCEITDNWVPRSNKEAKIAQSRINCCLKSPEGW